MALAWRTGAGICRLAKDCTAPDFYFDCPGRRAYRHLLHRGCHPDVVCGTRETIILATQLGFRACLDHALHFDGYRCILRVGGEIPQDARIARYELVLGPAFPECHLVTDFLRGTKSWVSAHHYRPSLALNCKDAL